MKVILINGRGGAGKDLFIQLVSSYLLEDYNVINCSTIDFIKAIARELGWNGEKDEAGRQFLSDLKMAWEKYNHGAEEQLIRRVLGYKEEEEYFEKFGGFKYSLENLIFIHCREPRNLDYLKTRLQKRGIPVSTLYIERKHIPMFQNNSDLNVTEYDYDYYINNDGTIEELNQKSKIFAETIRK